MLTDEALRRLNTHQMATILQCELNSPGISALLLHPVNNERQGRGGDLQVHPMKKIQVQVLKLKLYPASMEEASFKEESHMIQKVTLA